MFGNLAREKHERRVLQEQNELIFEAAEDVIPSSEDEGEITTEDLDNVIDEDADTVSDKVLDSFEEVVGSLADDPSEDVPKMTKEELKKYVEKVDSSSIEELDE